jgi:GntR family transcriptional regulator
MGRTASLELLEARLAPLDGTDADAFGMEAGSVALRTTKRWRADGVAVMLAHDVIPLVRPATGTDEIPDDIDVHEPVFTLAGQHGVGPVEWELVWPGAANLDTKTASLLERRRGEAALTLELMGVSRYGSYAYRAQEYHVRDAFRYGLIRSVRG